MTDLRQTTGGYRFLPGGGDGPYCSGVVADPGYEIVHATLREPVPIWAGFDLVERHLAAIGRPRQALCAFELRCTRPYPPDGWMSPNSFNQQYVARLKEWGLFVDGLNPIARSNVAPRRDPPAEQVLFAFSYTVPTSQPSGRPTFVVAGSGEESGGAARRALAGGDSGKASRRHGDDGRASERAGRELGRRDEPEPVPRRDLRRVPARRRFRANRSGPPSGRPLVRVQAADQRPRGRDGPSRRADRDLRRGLTQAGGGKRDAGWDGSGTSKARLAILPDLTHYNIFSSPALPSTVIPFLDAPMLEGS